MVRVVVVGVIVGVVVVGAVVVRIVIGVIFVVILDFFGLAINFMPGVVAWVVLPNIGV